MAVGGSFRKRTQMFVYPGRDEGTKQILTAKIQKLVIAKYDSCSTLEQGKLKTFLITIHYFTIWSREVVKMIENCEAVGRKWCRSSLPTPLKEKFIRTFARFSLRKVACYLEMTFNSSNT